MEKNKILMIVIIVLLVVLLSAIAFLGFNLAKYMKGNVNDSGEVTASASVAELTPDQITLIPISKAISTNLKTGTDGVSHIVSVNLSIGVNNTEKKESPKISASLTEKDAIVRDICLSTVSAKTYEELNRQDGPDVLRSEILTKLQEEFRSGLIYQVYISDWYLE